MNQLSENNLKFNVVVNGKVIATRNSRTQAEIALSSLNEDDKSQAVIVSVIGDGKQVLMG